MKIISSRLYNIFIGILLLYGFGINYAMVQTIDPNFISGAIEYILFIVIYFVSCILGIYLVNTKNTYIGFLGYNLIVIPFGIIINMFVSNYNQNLVENAVLLTGVTTGLMCFAGSLFPKFFKSIISGLTCALIVCIIVECIGGFVFSMHFRLMDWIVALIFCGYIGYDWGKANLIDKTINNALVSASNLYIDIINLFIRILSLSGSSNKK